jgi:hypothetical protein
MRGIAIEGDRPLTLPPLSRDRNYVIELTTGIPATIDSDDPPAVIVAYYKLRGMEHYLVRLASETLAPIYDTGHLPRYLFFGAGAMALVALALLRRELRDILARMAWVLRNLNHLARLNHMHVLGTAHIPPTGAVVLATNCRDEMSCRNVISATDRTVRLVRAPLSEPELSDAVADAEGETILAFTADALPGLADVQSRLDAAAIPVYYGPEAAGGPPRLAFGPPIKGVASPSVVEAAWQSLAALPDEELEEH